MTSRSSDKNTKKWLKIASDIR